ncbi:tRNA-dihydrouridine synthase family protein [Candidatus Kuenenbacteria bacterium]|nr:tRNA-dihydrouridine synthase family protein [Candidatus Kuenenbacteria bacterium]
MTKSFWHQIKKPILALAPMAGYTDSAFRLLCRESGADVVYSEMISVDGLCHTNQKTLDMLKFRPQETPIVFQLFGTDPKKFATATTIINKIITSYKLPITSYFGIDLNFGCPAPKVAKNGAGAALMNELEKSHQIIKAVCDHSQFPVSLKIRAGVKNVTAFDFINKVKDLPWTAVMVHGRTLKQGFVGDIDCQIIKEIKKLIPDKIVLANGGINNLVTTQKILSKTNADGLGLARGVIGSPWLFKEIKQNKSLTISATARRKVILRQAELFLEDNPNLIPLRKHLVHYFKGQKNASEMRQKIIQVTAFTELKNIL